MSLQYKMIKATQFEWNPTNPAIASAVKLYFHHRLRDSQASGTASLQNDLKQGSSMALYNIKKGLTPHTISQFLKSLTHAYKNRNGANKINQSFCIYLTVSHHW